MRRLARMSIRRRYCHCRFWGQSRRHALWHALFVPSHYREVRADMAHQHDLWELYR